MNLLLRYPEWKAYGALFLIYIIWGTTFGAIHIGVQTIPPGVFVCMRFLIAGVLLLSLCLFSGERWPTRADLKTHFWIGVWLFFAGNAVVCWAIQHIPTGLGATLTATNPFWMLWLSSLLPPQEKIPANAYLGLLIGFAGLLLLLAPQLAKPMAISPTFWLSVVSIMLMGFCWSLGSIYARKNSTQTSLLMGVGFQNLFAGLMLVPICLLFPETFMFQGTPASWMALAYLIVMGTMVAITCYLYALPRLPIPVIGTIAYVTPVITMAFGWLFLNEHMPSISLLGAMVVLAGVIVVQQCQHRLPQSKAVSAATAEKPTLIRMPQSPQATCKEGG